MSAIRIAATTAGLAAAAGAALWLALAWWLEAGPEPYDAWAGDSLAGRATGTTGGAS